MSFWDWVSDNIPGAKQIGGWVEDNVTVENLARLAGSAVLVGGGGALTELVDHVPGGADSPAGFAAKSIIVAAPGLIKGQGLGAAIVSGYVYQLQRAGTAYVASAGLTEGQAVFDKGLTYARGVIPPEVLEGGAAAVSYLNSAAGKQFVSGILNNWFNRPLQDVISSAGVKTGAAEARALSASTGTSVYEAMRAKGLDPEQVAGRLNGRADAAAIGLNMQASDYLYDIDWFDPATGGYHTDPLVWQNNYAIAESRGAGRATLAEVRRHWDAALAAQLGVDDPFHRASQVRRADPVFGSEIFAPVRQSSSGVLEQVLTALVLTSPAWGVVFGPAIARKLRR